MMPSIFDSSSLPVLEQVVNFAQSRHGVLAGNIANIDTPGYKTRDLSVEKFQKSLKEAMDQRRATPKDQHISPGLTGTTSQRSVDVDDLKEVKESMKHILYHDGHDVSLEAQVTELSKNQTMHNMAITLMSSQFRQLKAAISERVV